MVWLSLVVLLSFSSFVHSVNRLQISFWLRGCVFWGWFSSAPWFFGILFGTFMITTMVLIDQHACLHCRTTWGYCYFGCLFYKIIVGLFNQLLLIFAKLSSIHRLSHRLTCRIVLLQATQKRILLFSQFSVFILRNRCLCIIRYILNL